MQIIFRPGKQLNVKRIKVYRTSSDGLSYLYRRSIEMIEERKKYAKRILDVKDWESEGGTTSLPSFMHNSEKSQYRFIPQ